MATTPTTVLTLINKGEIKNIPANDGLAYAMGNQFTTLSTLLATINGGVTPTGKVQIPGFPVDPGVLASVPGANHCDVYLDPTSNTWTLQYFGNQAIPAASGGSIPTRQALGQSSFVDDITTSGNIQAYNWLRRQCYAYGVKPEYERLTAIQTYISNINNYKTLGGQYGY